MRGWKTIPLSQIAIPAGTTARHETNLPVYSVTKHRGFVASLEYFKKQVFSRELGTYTVVEPGEFAYATIHLDEGSIGICPERCLISPMYTVFKIASNGVHPPFVLRYLKSPRVLAEYPRLGQGSAERRRAISFERVGRVEIPLPSLAEQRRIAGVLDLAEALWAKRAATLAQFNTLTQSIFLNIFGDAGENPKGWPVQRVSEYVAEFQGGKSIESESDENVETRNRVLKVSAVTGMKFLAHESKPVPDGYEPPTEHFARPGDLLFSRANTTELVGAVAYVKSTPPNVLLPDKLWRFVWRQPAKVEPLFVWALFQTPAIRRQIGRRATGTSGSMKNISQEKVFGISTILPPLSLQQEFARRIAAVENLKTTHHTSLAELDALFVSLQHRAFRGEL